MSEIDLANQAKWGFLKNIVNIDRFFASGPEDSKKGSLTQTTAEPASGKKAQKKKSKKKATKETEEEVDDEAEQEISKNKKKNKKSNASLAQVKSKNDESEEAQGEENN